VGNSGQQGLLSRVAAVLWCLMLWPLYCWRGRARMQWQQSHAETTAAAAAAAGMPGLQLLLGGVYDDDAWPSMVLIESPSGFDEVLEQDSNV
jgi:hypothetical protein